MTLPNFLVIGAQKCGSSWLAARLAQHPDVYVHRGEIHFFDKGYNFSRGTQWYARHFESAAARTAIGEKTPDYLWANGSGVEDHLPNVHRNIAATLPRVKLIVVLRNPVERAVSAVGHIIRTGRVSPFHRVDALLIGNKRHLMDAHGVLDYGMYARQLKAFLELFPREQMLILFMEEDIIANATGGLARTCRFLGVDSTFRFQELKQRENAYRGSRIGLIGRYYAPRHAKLWQRVNRVLPPARLRPSESALRRLADLYRQPNDALRELVGHVPASWQTNTAAGTTERAGV